MYMRFLTAIIGHACELLFPQLGGDWMRMAENNRPKIWVTGARAKMKSWRTRGLDPTSAWLLEFHPNNSQVGYVSYSDIGGSATRMVRMK